MSLEKVSDYLDKMKAVAHYDKVVEERDMLVRQLEDGRERDRDELDQLEKKISQLESLRVKYSESTFTLEEFDMLVEDRFRKWKEDVMEEAVESRWEREGPRRLMQMLRAELQVYPEGCFPQLRERLDSAALKKRDELLSNRHSWPKWFRDRYRIEVQQGIQLGIDEAFNTRVEFNANERLQQLIQVEWPRFVEENITPFCRNSLKSQLTNMVYTFIVICEKCGTTREVTLTPDNLAELIKKPSITTDCRNPRCMDFLWRHRILITLGMVIDVIIRS